MILILYEKKRPIYLIIHSNACHFSEPVPQRYFKIKIFLRTSECNTMVFLKIQTASELGYTQLSHLSTRYDDMLIIILNPLNLFKQHFL